MARVSGMDDMFGNVPQAGELSLDEQPVVSKGPPVQTRATIRVKILGLLAELAAATDVMPWIPRELHANRGFWPFYMDWFEPEDKKAYTAEFHAHLTRLGEPLVNGPYNYAWSASESIREMVASGEIPQFDEPRA